MRIHMTDSTGYSNHGNHTPMWYDLFLVFCTHFPYLSFLSFYYYIIFLFIYIKIRYNKQMEHMRTPHANDPRSFSTPMALPLSLSSTAWPKVRIPEFSFIFCCLFCLFVFVLLFFFFCFLFFVCFFVLFCFFFFCFFLFSKYQRHELLGLQAAVWR
jgi:hypothetical protein